MIQSLAPAPSEGSNDRSRVGLCADCAHAHRVESPRGSRFFLCGLSLTDSCFAKYPRLPVLSCAGYDKKDKPSEAK